MDNSFIIHQLEAGESRTLDFKAPVGWNELDHGGKAEIAKDIVGFANTNGGMIIIGVSESSGSLDPVGVSDAQLASWDSTKVNQFVNVRVAPPVNVTLSVRKYEEKNFIVISVPVFTGMPHVTTKNSDAFSEATLLVRTNNNECAPIKDANELNSLIEKAMLNRKGQLLESIASILEHGKLSPTQEVPNFLDQISEARAQLEAKVDIAEPLDGFRQMWAHPESFQNDRFLINEIESATAAAFSQYGPDWSFLDQSGSSNRLPDGFESLVNLKDIRNHPIVRYWQTRQSGLLFQRVLMWEDPAYFPRLPDKFADIDETVRYVVLGVDATIKYFQNLNLQNERLILRFSIDGAEGRQLFSARGAYIRGPYVAFSSPLVVARTVGIEDLIAHQIDYSEEIAIDLMRQFNWKNAFVTENSIKSILLRDS